jgi:acetone carboxylase gamma subunit
MEEELDLTKANWSLDSEIYLHSIKESVEENYPESEMKTELDLIGYVLEDLLDKEKLQKFLKVLEEKYPNNVV